MPAKNICVPGEHVSEIAAQKKEDFSILRESGGFVEHIEIFSVETRHPQTWNAQRQPCGQRLDDARGYIDGHVCKIGVAGLQMVYQKNGFGAVAGTELDEIKRTSRTEDQRGELCGLLTEYFKL